MERKIRQEQTAMTTINSASVLHLMAKATPSDFLIAL